MYVRTICFPVTVLGPGRRLGIWLSGCSADCPGCMSPELRDRRPEDRVPLETIGRLVERHADEIDGVTISGGEPFEQAEELHGLARLLRERGVDDILVYTGWTIDAVRADEWGSRVLELISTLIDGPYVDELNDGVGIRGSSNQTVHRLRPSPDYDYEGCERRVQGFVFENRLFTAGLR